MNRFSSLVALATLSPPIEDGERDQAMRRDICVALGASENDHYWPWVLHHHFGWTARDIAFWRSDFESRNCDECEGQDYLCSRCWLLYDQFEADERENEQVINQIEVARWDDPDFERTTSANLVYLYFHFLHFEPEYRTTVVAQSQKVRALCDDEFFCGILWHLGWSHTEFAEAVLEGQSHHA